MPICQCGLGEGQQLGFKPRRKRCPVVIQQVRKAERNGVRGKELEEVYKRRRTR